MWNYRIIHYDSDKGAGLKNFYGLYEVIYNDKGEISAHSEEPEVIGDTPEELIETLELMLSDAKKCKSDILKYNQIDFCSLIDEDYSDAEEITLEELDKILKELD
jgi:hypothetical protein